MEKVTFNTCVQKPLYNYSVRQAQNQTNVVNCGLSFKAIGEVGDSVNVRDKKQVYLEKLEKLFPQGGFDKLCKDINKDFGIDYPAKVTLVGDNDGVTAGGYTYSKNEITLSLSDLLGSDTKIVGVKNGKKIILISPTEKYPLFIDKKTAEAFVNMHSQHGNLGFDKLIVEPVTEDEQRKFIVQKLSHEIIHSQQHMIMRKTEDIGEKEIIKAWTHIKPNNLIEEKLLELRTNNLYNQSYWKNQPKTEQTIKQDSVAGHLAKIWLNAIRNYPPFDSPEYRTNAIEVDAYQRSAEYANKKFGNWNKTV